MTKKALRPFDYHAAVCNVLEKFIEPKHYSLMHVVETHRKLRYEFETFCAGVAYREAGLAVGNSPELALGLAHTLIETLAVVGGHFDFKAIRESKKYNPNHKIPKDEALASLVHIAVEESFKSCLGKNRKHGAGEGWREALNLNKKGHGGHPRHKH